MKLTYQVVIGLVTVSSVSAAAVAGDAGTAFTVQALLKESGQPVSGNVDVIGKLFDAAAEGNQIGPSVQVNNVAVDNGLLTWELDFGADAFGGRQRHLEIAVRSPHDPTNIQPFTTLDQRIRITPTPEAIHAQTAQTIEVPVVLSSDDSVQATATLENVGADGVALNVLGKLTVGDAEQVVVDPLGNVTAVGVLSGSDLIIGNNASVGGDANVGSDLTVAKTAHVSTAVTVGADPNVPEIILDGVMGNVSASGNVLAVGEIIALDGAALGDASTDTSLVVGTLNFAFGPLAPPNAVIEGATGDARFDGDLHVKGAFHDSNDSSGRLEQVLTSRSVGTEWRDAGRFSGDVDIEGDLLVGPSDSPPDSRLFSVERGIGEVNVRSQFKVKDTAGEDIFSVERGVVSDERGVERRITAHEKLRIRAALHDTLADAPGELDQVLRSTGNGVKWTPLIIGAVDAGGFAITNIGNVEIVGNSNLGDGPEDQTTVTGNMFVDSGGELSESRGRFPPRRLHFDGPNKAIHLPGKLFDGEDVPGTPDQVLVSTGTGVVWTDPPTLVITADLDMQGNSITNIANVEIAGNSNLGNGLEDQTTVIGNLNVGSGGAPSDGRGVPGILLHGETKAMHLPGRFYDSGDSPGTLGQLLSSTSIGTQWVNCDCGGGGGNQFQNITVTGTAKFGSDPNAPTVEIDGATGDVDICGTLNAKGSFNIVNNLVTDSVQISNGVVFSPSVQVSATNNTTAPVVFFTNFGAGPTLQVGGDSLFNGDVFVFNDQVVQGNHTVFLNQVVNGDLAVKGTITKGGGSFKIDHPLDPENQYLYHSFVESPDMMNIYNGNIATGRNGYATVVLPDWFEALNQDFRYQLTVIDETDSDAFVLAKVVRTIAGNEFTIRTSEPHVEVSWQVTGVRHDAFANANRISVEEYKPDAERGKYLHPDAFGLPEELGLANYARPQLFDAGDQSVTSTSSRAPRHDGG